MKANFKKDCPLCGKLIEGNFDGYVGDTGIVINCPHCQISVQIPDLTEDYINNHEWFIYDANCNDRKVLMNRAALLEQQQSQFEAEFYLEYSEQYGCLITRPDGENDQSFSDRCRWYTGISQFPESIPQCSRDYLDCVTGAYTVELRHAEEHLDQCQNDSRTDLMDCERGYFYAVQIAETGQYINGYAMEISDFEAADRIARENSDKFPLDTVVIVAEMEGGEIAELWKYDSEKNGFVSWFVR